MKKLETLIDKSTDCDWSKESRNKIIMYYKGEKITLEKRIQSFDVVLEVTLGKYRLITGLPFNEAYKRIWDKAYNKCYDTRSTNMLVNKALAYKILDDIK